MTDNLAIVRRRMLTEGEGVPSEDEQLRRYEAMSPRGRRIGNFFTTIGFGPPYIPTAEQMKVFWLVGLAICLNHYDLGIFSLATPRFQAEFGISEAQLGTFTAIARFGVLAAFVLAAMADRVGRQKLLMVTIVGAAFSTGASAFAPNAESFIALQTAMRTFAYAEDMLCFVVIAEVMDPRLRGWAMGGLAALGAAGHGLASIVYVWVDVLPYDWRALYFIGVFPMLLVAILRRSLTEPARFADQKAAREAQGPTTWRDKLQPVISLATDYPGRLAAMCLTIIPLSFAMTAPMSFVPKYLQDFHDYSPGNVSALFLIGGVIGVAGNFVAGRLSDRVGRRTVLIVGMLVGPSCIGVLYMGPGGIIIPFMWATGLFFFFAAEVMLAAYGAELFPTSYRSTASAVRAIASTCTGIGALFAHSWLIGQFDTFEAATAISLVAVPIAIVVAWIALPETASRTLEDISPELH
ncbi:MAG: MFS transporter [Alphaproteobacteria bacterium]